MPAEQGPDSKNPLFGVVGHGYQPPRELEVDVDFGGRHHHAGFSVVPWVNPRITEQVYRPILGEVESLPPGLVTSVYAPLRSYLKRYNPELFAKVKEVIARTPDKEYSVLGDSLVHVILPLLPSEDQAMLLEAGRIAFRRDFGFDAKGIWLPETAVSREVLHNAAQAGYEFVPLHDSQIGVIPEGVNLDADHNICFVRPGGEGEEIAVLLGNSGLSERVSYHQWTTYNADAFMDGRKQIEAANGWNSLLMMDLERFGHHQPGAEEFLKRILSIQQNFGFSPLNMQAVLEQYKQGKPKTVVEVRDNSSWSCPHCLGRWTGNCGCDDPSESVLRAKRHFYTSLQELNTLVNSGLDAIAPGWRKEFARLFAELSDDIFTGVNFGPALCAEVIDKGGDEEKARLYLAKIEVMVGMTSCGWFFGQNDGYERNIPASMIAGARDLLAVPSA
jgi:hypothetical protein